MDVRVERVADKVEALKLSAMMMAVAVVVVLWGLTAWAWSDTRSEIRAVRERMLNLEIALQRIDSKLDRLEHRLGMVEDCRR